MTQTIVLEECAGDGSDVDRNTLDMTAWRSDGHRFMRGATYNDRSYDGRCLKCGLNARLAPRGRVLEVW